MTKSNNGSSSACTLSFSCLGFFDRLQFHVFHGLIYLFSIAIACCSQFLNYWSGLCTLIYSWLEKNKLFISMVCRALFAMLPVFWIINFQLIWMNTLRIYMDCVALAILVNESKFRPLLACLLNQLFLFLSCCWEHDL